jgi:hypothetical protein
MVVGTVVGAVVGAVVGTVEQDCVVLERMDSHIVVPVDNVVTLASYDLSAHLGFADLGSQHSVDDSAGEHSSGEHSSGVHSSGEHSSGQGLKLNKNKSIFLFVAQKLDTFITSRNILLPVITFIKHATQLNYCQKSP